jgi:hypothetical protein
VSDKKESVRAKRWADCSDQLFASDYVAMNFTTVLRKRRATIKKRNQRDKNRCAPTIEDICLIE